MEKRHHANHLDNSAVNALILQQVPLKCKFPPGRTGLIFDFRAIGSTKQ
jgi:hypothetical protein